MGAEHLRWNGSVAVIIGEHVALAEKHDVIGVKIRVPLVEPLNVVMVKSRVETRGVYAGLTLIKVVARHIPVARPLIPGNARHAPPVRVAPSAVSILDIVVDDSCAIAVQFKSKVAEVSNIHAVHLDIVAEQDKA